MASVRLQDSRRLAGVVGPTLAVFTLSESPWIQPHLYDAQTPPVVYLSGALFFVAGLAIVRVHNLWVLRWPVLITLIGWLSIVLGLTRLFAAVSYPPQTSSNVGFFAALEAVGFAVGVFLTFQGYRPQSSVTARERNE